MNKKVTFFDNFYWKVFLKSWLFCCVVYSFMLFQFWWGNHDWDYLKYGVKFSSGFFEARYAAHLVSLLLFDGNVLPVFMLLSALALLVFMGMLIAYYLEMEKNTISYMLFLLLIGVSPYNFVIIYYLFIADSLFSCGCVAAAVLFCATAPYKWWKFVLGVLGYIYILGCYPPVIALTAILFVAKQIILVQKKRQINQRLFSDTLFLIGQASLSFLVFKCVFDILDKYNFLYLNMYNVRVNSLMDIPSLVPAQIVSFFGYVPSLFANFGFVFAFFIGVLFLVGIFYIWNSFRNKLIAFAWIIAFILSSRIVFLLADSANVAKFRVEYWAVLGMETFVLAVLFSCKQKAVKNILYLTIVLSLFSFIRMTFYIQKMQYLSFKGERFYQGRIENRLADFPNLLADGYYSVLRMGYADFSEKYCYATSIGCNMEFFADTAMPADFSKVIFWESLNNMHILRLGFWSDRLWVVDNTKMNLQPFVLKDENISNLRYWLYQTTKAYPSKDCIYVDDKLVVFNLDDKFFRPNREKVIFGMNILKR